MSERRDPFLNLSPDPGWLPFTLPFAIGTDRFERVDTRAESIRMRFFEKPLDHSLAGWVWFGDLVAGPPGHAHGGCQAFALDEAMGAAAWLAGRPSVAGELNIKLFEMVPLHAAIGIEASITLIDGKKATVVSKILDFSGKVYARGEATFVQLSKTRILELLAKQGVSQEEVARYFERMGRERN